ncbi:MAG: hypothetical protein JOZ96_10735 [Acidobacteria bacterium]|nr:hypothetical protein [Acidobacteriota bacterium]
MAARIVSILRSVGDGAAEWDDAAAAAKAQAQVADLLWDDDAGSAQGYLTKAWDSAGRVEEPTQGASRFRNTSPRTEARREVILVARKRAPELANRWLEQMAGETKPNEGKQSRGVFDDRSQRSTVLLQLATQSIAADPHAAAELAVESLRDGISFGLQNFLIALQEKDFELAQKVFRAALQRLRGAGLNDPNELLILYSYLYTPGRVTAANLSGERGSSQVAVGRDRPRVTAAAELSPALALEFLRLSADLLTAAPLPVATADPQQTAREQISVIGVLLGKLSRQLPDSAAALQARLQQIQVDAQYAPASTALKPDAPPPPAAGESRAEYEERYVDFLEESASKEPSGLSRNIAYAKAALATDVGGYERGWKIARRIEDDSLRAGVTNWLTYRAALHLAGAGELDRAHELLLKDEDTAQRASCLVVGAQKLLQAKDAVRARQWLEEARFLVKQAEPDESWTAIALGVVAVYGRFDGMIAADALSDAVKLINQSKGALQGDERAPSLRRFSGLPLPDFTYGTDGFGLQSAVGVFKPDQFEEVAGILSRISSPKVRGTALVTLCRSFKKRRDGRGEKSAPPAPEPSAGARERGEQAGHP